MRKAAVATDERRGKGGIEMLKTTNLCKAFDGRTVLSHVNLCLETGGHYALMGPSGCGKTTFLHILLGLIKPDSGTVRCPSGTRFSAVFQENRLLDHMTATANVSLVSPAPQAEIEALLVSLGIDPESLPLPVSAFSGGMKRRVALARALLADFDVLLLDEPFKGLDEETRAHAMQLVNERTKHKTVLLVTHDKSETEGYTPVSL